MKRQVATKFQEQFWILDKISRNNAAYNIPVVFKLSAKPNIDRLENALNLLVKKYDILLSEYSLENRSILMRFIDKNEFKYKIEIEHNQTQLTNNQLPPEILQEIQKPFDLSKAPLFRVKLFDYAGTVYLSFVFHHIIIDLRSKEIFFNELEKLYNESSTHSDYLDTVSIKQYSTYAQEHNDWLNSAEAKKMIQHWNSELPPVNHLLNLPISQTRPKSINFEGKRKYFTLDNSIGQLISQFSKNIDINSFTFCLSAFFILLNKLSHQDKIVIGVPLSNRRDQGNTDVFGCFVNIVPIVVSFEGDPTINSIIKQVRNKLLFAHRKQEIPYLTMLEQEKENRNLAYNPYFQTGFTFEPLAEVRLDGIKAEPIPVEKQGAQLDLFITLWEDKQGFSGYIEYATQLFTDSMAKRIELIYKKVIQEIIFNKERISDILVLIEEDKVNLDIWNRTNININTNKCLHKQFEEQVLATPDHIALKFNDKTLTYSQLNTHANRLSHYLIANGINIEDIIGISLARSFELIVAIIAIHKAGGAYLPLDARYPTERINTIIEDGKPKIILTTKENAATFSGYDNLILIDDILFHPLSDIEINPDVPVKANNLAYILFTSGSTGRPKGVMIEHQSVINKLTWMQYKHPIEKEESLLLKTPITFDVSVWELFWWYFSGSSLTILPPDGEKDPKTIIYSVKNNRICTLIFVPSMFAPFIEYVKSKNNASDLGSLKYIILIGETVSTQLVINFNEIRTKEFSPKLVNTYGPTEATVAVSYYDCSEINPVNKVFIGKPIFNTKLFIIDKNNHICPIGVSGELVISGINLARGYKNSPELTNERFIEIKDLEGRNLKIYRTGDMARWDETGEIDFIGRVDNQVKIRGYRIELGDIESKLLTHESIESAVVSVYEIDEGNKQLIAYIVFKEGSTTTTPEIKKFLMLTLPEYMVPPHIIVLNNLPLNSSEKVDRKALPKPTLETSKHAVSPKHGTEKALYEIWCKLLNTKLISVTDNFFDIGGNSLLVISMIAQIKELMNYDIEPVTIMQFPNIRELSEYLDDMNSQNGQDKKYNEIVNKAMLRRARNQIR